MLYTNYAVVLASNSPRRKQLLSDLGLAFSVAVKPTPEDYPAGYPVHDIATLLAERKATAFWAEMAEDTCIIAADTTVVAGSKLLEKPAQHAEALDMLEQLSGQTHEVITGVCVLTKTHKRVFKSVTTVTFRHLSRAEMQYYIAQYQPFDKAGAYGIQEWLGMVGIAHLQGSYYNVVGLPTEPLFSVLKELNIVRI